MASDLDQSERRTCDACGSPLALYFSFDPDFAVCANEACRHSVTGIKGAQRERIMREGELYALLRDGE